MKQLLLTTLCIFLLIKTGFSQIQVDTIHIDKNGLERLLIEKVTVPSGVAGIPAGSITYRLFVDLQADYEFLACSGYDNTTPFTYITIRSTQAFYNETTFGGASGASANPALFGVFPALEYDTYAADGRLGTGNVGVLKSVSSSGYTAINANSTPAGDLNIPAPISIFTNNISTELYDYNSGWIVSGAVGGPDPVTNIVFIGQLTTPGTLSMELNISLQNPYGQIRYISGIKYPLPTPPVVSFISPADGSTFVAGTPINIQAGASDADGTIDSVVFLVNGAGIGKDITDPYQTSWTPVANGTYSLVAIATDDSGLSESDTITVHIDNIVPPVVSITNPVAGNVFFVYDPVIIAANATDDGTIDSVVFYVNGSKVFIDLTFPYQYSWTALPGTATLTAKAYDNEGASSTSAPVEIIVKNPVMPSIAITSPDAGSTFIAGDTLHIEGNASDTDGTIDSVELFINGEKIKTDVVSPYSFKWMGVTGTNIIELVATDNDQLSKSASVTVYVNDNSAPVVAIDSPDNGMEIQLGNGILIEATASDSDGTINFVEFFIDGIKAGEDNSAPYSYEWTSTETGTVIIKAVATDNMGLSGKADSVTIDIIDINLPPTISITAPAENVIIAPDSLLTIVVNASDSDGEIDSVEIFLNRSKLGVITTMPYEITWTAVLGSYTITAYAYDNDKASAQDDISIEVSDVDGIDITATRDKLKVYPNPVKDRLNIDFSEFDYNDITRITIFNLIGNTLMIKSIDAASEIYHIDLSELNSGIYMLVASGAERKYSLLFIKE